MKLAPVVFATGLFAFGTLLNAAQPVKPPGNDDCLTCHSDKDAKASGGRSVFVPQSKFDSSVHGKAGVACVDCHADLAKTSDFPHKARLHKVDCASCHDGAGAAHPFHPEIARALRGKQEPQVACADCHGTHEISPVRDAGFRFARARQAQACGDCHSETSQHFLSSEHGKAFSSGATTAPGCISCHRNAVTAGSGLSPMDLKRAQERLCLNCHLYDESVKSRASPTAGFIASFDHSVHGNALARGDARAPNCVDCHGAHDERHGFDPSSFVNKMQVQQVCARCHAAENRLFSAGVHGAALRKGNKDAPACTDCHGEHTILSPRDPSSPVAAANISARVCSPCHGSLKLTEKWNIPRDRSKTFADSYHGLAARGGSVEVANCASCHGAHDILPSSNPASRVNRANLAATCGASGCHPGANARFAMGNVHVTGTQKDSPLVYWIATLYVILIVGVVGGMLLHNLLDFLRKSARQLKIRRGEIEEEPVGHSLYLRMTLSERFQHGALALSFTLLVLTGFMLRYPEAWWVLAIRRVRPGAGVFTLRSLIHRVSAVVMVVASLYHVGLSAPDRPRPQAPRRPLVAWKGPARRDRDAQVQHRPVEEAARIRPLQLHREERVLGARLGHVRHGRDRDRHVVRQHVHPAPGKARIRRQPDDPFLGSLARHAGDPRLALLLRDLQSRRLSHEHVLAEREADRAGDGGGASAGARARSSRPPPLSRRRAQER